MTWVPKNRTNDSSNSSEDRRESEDKELDEKLDEGIQLEMMEFACTVKACMPLCNTRVMHYIRWGM